MKTLKNIYLDGKGLHRRKPTGCNLTGTAQVLVDHEKVRVNQCNNAKPHPDGYRAITRSSGKKIKIKSSFKTKEIQIKYFIKDIQKDNKSKK